MGSPERSIFRVDNRSSRPLVRVGAVLVLGTMAAVFGCGNNEQPQPTSTTPVTATKGSSPISSPTTEVTPTPQETVVRQQSYTSIPKVPPEFQTSPQAITDYWTTLRLKSNMFRLVENAFYDFDVISKSAAGEVEIGPGTIEARVINPSSIAAVKGVKARICADILEAAGPVAAGIIIQFNIVASNTGDNPFSEIGVTEQEKKEFLTPTTCKAAS